MARCRRSGSTASIGVTPTGPAGDAVDRGGSAALVHGVVHDRHSVPRGLEHTVVGRCLADADNGAELQQGAPRRSVRLRHGGAEHAVAELFGDRDTLRSVGRDQERHLDRSVRDEARRVDHLDHGPVPRRGSRRAAAPCTTRTYSATSAHRMGRWPRTWRPVNPAPTPRRPGQARAAASVAIAAAFVIGCRSEGTSTPGPRPIVEVHSRGERKRDPHVWVQRRRVVQPRPLVSQRLCDPDVLGRLHRRCERTRQLQHFASVSGAVLGNLCVHGEG